MKTKAIIFAVAAAFALPSPVLADRPMDPMTETNPEKGIETMSDPSRNSPYNNYTPGKRLIPPVRDRDDRGIKDEDVRAGLKRNSDQEERNKNMRDLRAKTKNKGVPVRP